MFLYSQVVYTSFTQEISIFLLYYSIKRSNLPIMKFMNQEPGKSLPKLPFSLFGVSNLIAFLVETSTKGLGNCAEMWCRLESIKACQCGKVGWIFTLVYWVDYKFDTKVSTHMTSAVSTLRNTYLGHQYKHFFFPRCFEPHEAI